MRFAEITEALQADPAKPVASALIRAAIELGQAQPGDILTHPEIRDLRILLIQCAQYSQPESGEAPRSIGDVVQRIMLRTLKSRETVPEVEDA